MIKISKRLREILDELGLHDYDLIGLAFKIRDNNKFLRASCQMAHYGILSTGISDIITTPDGEEVINYLVVFIDKRGRPAEGYFTVGYIQKSDDLEKVKDGEKESS